MAGALAQPSSVRQASEGVRGREGSVSPGGPTQPTQPASLDTTP